MSDGYHGSNGYSPTDATMAIRTATRRVQKDSGFKISSQDVFIERHEFMPDTGQYKVYGIAARERFEVIV